MAYHSGDGNLVGFIFFNPRTQPPRTVPLHPLLSSILLCHRISWALRFIFPGEAFVEMELLGQLKKKQKPIQPTGKLPPPPSLRRLAPPPLHRLSRKHMVIGSISDGAFVDFALSLLVVTYGYMFDRKQPQQHPKQK